MRGMGDPWLDEISKHWPLLRRRSVEGFHPGLNQYANYLFEQQLKFAAFMHKSKFSEISNVNNELHPGRVVVRLVNYMKNKEYVPFEEITP